MKIIRNYYENICKTKQTELMKRWESSYSTKYRWQDIAEQYSSNKNNK